MVLEGSTSGEVFEAYVEHLLAPTLRAGQVVVMDNLSAHKGGRVRELIEERDCELIYLPPYSPDLNPIQPYRRGVFQDQAVPKRDESS
jgi:transposase